MIEKDPNTNQVISSYCNICDVSQRCKGMCLRHKATRPNTGNRYLEGQKRCQVCQIFIINWQGLFCPCCGGRLRNKPRNSKFKLALRSNNIINSNK
jgi:hypothetical protein